MAQYGDWLVMNDPLRERVACDMMKAQARGFLKHVYGSRRPKGSLKIFLNTPYEWYDEEREEWVKGFTCGWKWTSHE